MRTDALHADAEKQHVQRYLHAAEAADAARLPDRHPAVPPGPPKGAAEHRGIATATADAAVGAAEDKLIKI